MTVSSDRTPVAIVILDDNVYEGLESFTLTISGLRVRSGSQQTTITINDENDLVTRAPPSEGSYHVSKDIYIGNVCC